MELFVIGVSGPPSSGKSNFCTTFGEYLKSLGREVRILNMDPACEVYLAYKPDWNITSFVKVSEVQKEMGLGFNGALMWAMTSMNQNMDVLLGEMQKFPRNTFVIMDLPGQVELYTHCLQIKYIYEIIHQAGNQVCNMYLAEALLLRTIDFFISYTANVTFCMTHLEVPQINLLTKVDMLIKAKRKEKLPLPFEYYRNWKNIQQLVEELESDGTAFHQKHKAVIRELAEVCKNYALVDYMPCTLIDNRFLQLILYQVDRALGYSSNNPKKDFKMVNSILKLSETEKDMERAVTELLDRCHVTKRK